LLSEIFPAIASRGIPDYRGISLCKRIAEDEVEFVTSMWFDSFDSVRAFAGGNYDVAVVAVKARAFLKRFDSRSAHDETIVAPPFQL